MFRKIAIIFITTLMVLYANAQKVPVHFFSREDDARGYDGDYAAYAVQIFSDSTFEIRVYKMPGMVANATFLKTTYFGKYYQIKDSCIIKYWSSYTENRTSYSAFKYKPKWSKNKSAIPPVQFVSPASIYYS